uniref:Transcription factor LOB2 n=1 Tax=Diospyros kaki TaxID=35925 RepID=A0A3S8T905_DIOKA|nr:transcription factor LOB2 [Diospyros kaki]
MSSSSSPCAACKLLRRKCTQECVLAPYFPPDEPQKFANVHKVFGASNVGKILNELKASDREDAVNSLAYEANARIEDPVYGCVGLISILQHRLRQVHNDLYAAKKELANYVGPSAMLPIFQQPGFVPHHPNNPSSSSFLPYNVPPQMMGPSTQLVIAEPQQQMLEAQQQQEMLRAYQQQQEIVRFNSEYEPGVCGSGGFNQMGGSSYENPYQISEQPQEQGQHHLHLQFQSQLVLQQQQRSGSDEDRGIGPSC